MRFNTRQFTGWASGALLALGMWVAAILAASCSSEAGPGAVARDAGADTGSVDGAVDAGGDAGELPRGAPPASWAAADFIDVHTHCEVLTDCAGGRCCDTSGWQLMQARFTGYPVLLSNEYWLINQDLFPKEALDYFTGLNDTVKNTAALGSGSGGSGSGGGSAPSVGWFAGLRCLYQRKLDAGWAEACKAEALGWARQGALGFKDHIGKQWEGGEVEAGYFIGGWNRFNGFCSVAAGSTTPNSSCVQQPSVRYLALEPAWREVVRYIVADLKLPIVSHASSWQGATTTCYDPQLGRVDGCAAVTRRHQQALASWLATQVDEAARRRLVVAHLGFLTDDPAGLAQLLDTGVSVDSSRLEAFAAAGCDGRSLFAAYPTQVLFGTDRRVSQACLPESYSAWMHIFSGPANQQQTFDTCQGSITARGMQLGTPVVAGCPDVSEGSLERVLKGNFLALYE